MGIILPIESHHYLPSIRILLFIYFKNVYCLYNNYLTYIFYIHFFFFYVKSPVLAAAPDIPTYQLPIFYTLLFHFFRTIFFIEVPYIHSCIRKYPNINYLQNSFYNLL